MKRKVHVSTKAAVGGFEKTKIFFSQVRTEMAKVSYPSKDDLRTYTIVVIVASAVISTLMGVWDKLLSTLLNILFGFLAG